MEFIVCMLLAAIFTGGRAASDIIHGVKGTTPPHLEKARLKAQRQPVKARRGRSPLAAGKPTLRDVAAVYWGDAMADAIAAHNRRRNDRGARVRTPLKERIKRFGLLLWRPVGETPPTVIDSTTTKGDTVASTEEQRAERTAQAQYDVVQAQAVGDHDEARSIANGERHNQLLDGVDDTTAQNIRNQQAPTPLPQALAGTGTQTGEAVNYETTVVELEALIEQLRAHLDSTIAAEAAVQQAKVAVNNSQVSYNPAANAAASISEHLPALNVDAETVGHTGTVANAMPPNDVNVMFDQLEAMEAKVAEQRANAEAALGSAEAALKTVQEKYGDAHATVAGELAGDSRFLAGSGSAAA
jgi:hypothetical protein